MLLKTKLFAPPIRQNAVPRLRLLQQLGQPAPARLTLIHAPAGYGKTTLARQWLDQLPNPSAWLSLDVQDNDPVRFWRYVSGALGQPPRTAAGTPGDSDHEAWITDLLNRWSQPDHALPTLLILDDFHVIQDPVLLASVSWFLDRLPTSLHVLITSRSLPSLHIPQRRVRNTVTEIGAGALSFGPAEARLFFEDTLQLSLTARTLDALQEKTEGWAAALQLAGLSLKQQPVPTPDWLERTSPTLLVDYLAEEVLASLDEALQQFLLRMALVRRFSLDLCRHLAPVPEAPQTQDYVKALREQNLFLIPLDERGNWFRFHDLFRENLLNIARQRLKQQLPQLCRQAADWFRQANDHEEAIHCLLEGERWADAAELIEELGVSRMLAGQNESLNWWLGQLPAETVRWRPRLALIQAWNLFCTERVSEAEPYLDQADQQLVPDQPQYRALKAQIAIFRSQLARFRGDESGIRYWSQQAQELSSGADTQLNAVTRLALGMELFQDGKHIASQQILEQAAAAARREHNHFCMLSTSVLLAHLQFQQGLTRKALDTLDSSRDWLLEEGQSPHFIAFWQNIVYVNIHREIQQLDQARACMAALLESGEAGTDAAFGALVRLVQSTLFSAEGKWDAALAEVAMAEPVMERDRSHWSTMGPPVGMLRAQYLLRSGRQTEALRWALDQEQWLLPSRAFVHEETRIVLARCLALLNRHPQALEVLDQIEEDAATQHRILTQVRALTTRALVQSHQQDWLRACASLQRALELSARAGYRRVFLDEGAALEPLFSRLSEQGVHGWWEEAQLAPASAQADLSALIEPLTHRELEVLGMIASGHRNQAIADTLHIAVTTTKAHIRNIFEKMAVTSRTQAVARGRELGLIR